MKTIRKTITLPDEPGLPATITIYQKADPTLDKHEDLSRPDFPVWGVGEIDHPAFKNRVWTITSNSVSSATGHLWVQMDEVARQQFGYPSDNPFHRLTPQTLR